MSDIFTSKTISSQASDVTMNISRAEEGSEITSRAKAVTEARAPGFLKDSTQEDDMIRSSEKSEHRDKEPCK